MMPFNADPQKKIARMMTTGWRPVRSPMILGVSR